MHSQSSDTRVCHKCGVTKPADVFGNHKWGCRDCMAADQRERRKRYALAHGDDPPPIRVRTDATCRRCGMAKPADAFSTHWRKTIWCKSCYAEVETARHRRHGMAPRKRPETFADGTARRCTRCGEIKRMGEFPRHKPTARHKLSSTGRMPNCTACMRAKTQERRRAHLDQAKGWFLANPERMRLHRNRRRAREMGMDAERIRVADWHQLLELFGFRCAYCWSQPEKLEQDHVRPLSRGGAHALTNIVPACRGCNGRKHAKTLLEFLLTAR